MEIKTHLAAKSNYGARRKPSDIKYIVLHYTANDGDSAGGNANYFASPHNPKSSAHYFVDDSTVVRSVPDDYIAYSVGGSKYTDCKTTGGGRLYGKATNANTLNIEMCDTVRDGVVRAQPATITNTIKLVRQLMQTYNVDIDHVIRHFDVNGKHCPAYLMDEREWSAFKAHILGYQIGQTYRTTAMCYLRTSPGTGRNKLQYKEASDSLRKKCTQFDGCAKLKKCMTFKLMEIKVIGANEWGRIKSGYWIPLKYNGMVRAKLEK